MGSLKVYATVAGFLAVATSITTARSADLLPPPPPPMPVVEPISDDFGGGWYLRGDVGVSRYDGGKTRSASSPNATFYENDFGSGSFAGFGAGYQFSSWFRADVTGEYRFSKGFKLFDRETFVDQGFVINGFEKAHGDYSSAVVLLNGYVDLGTWYGITPFVGGGFGYVHHWMEGFDTNTYNYYVALPGTNPGMNAGKFRDKDKGSFAWALHAGVAYDVTQNTKLEIAYRYLNLGDVSTGAINCFCGRTGPGIKIRDLEAHEIKLGMRWALGGPAAAPAYEPAPLVRRY